MKRLPFSNHQRGAFVSVTGVFEIWDIDHDEPVITNGGPEGNATKLVAVNDEESPLMIAVCVPGATSRVVFDTQTVIMS
ncbi:MAG: hypothetical protein WCC65_15780 [Pseudonocardiaceae bacterium]